MWLDLLARFLHVSGAAVWVGGSLTLIWVWLPALRASASAVEGVKILQQALPHLQRVVRLASILLLASGGYRAWAGYASPALPLGKLIGLLLMVSLWIVLTGLFEMIIPQARRSLATLSSGEANTARGLSTTLTDLTRLGTLALWLSLLLMLDGAYLLMG